MGLVGGALLLQGLVDIVFDYRETRDTAEAVQRTEVRGAAAASSNTSRASSTT
jgi:hypothetical protein